MSERTPKQPLNDPEYTVPEYSVLLPSDEAENSTAGGDAAFNNVTSGSAADNSAAEGNAPGGSASEHASIPEQTTTGYTAPVASEQVIPKRPQAMRSVMWCAAVSYTHLGAGPADAAGPCGRVLYGGPADGHGVVRIGGSVLAVL